MGDAKPASQPAEEGITATLWGLLTSVRLALILILMLAAATLAGAVLIQAPGLALLDPEAYEQWLETVRPKYGLWTDLFSLLGLFNVYSSPGFLGLIGLLALNVVICTLDRLPRLWRPFARPRVRAGEAYFQQARHRWELSLAGLEPGEVIPRATDVLHRHGYRVKVSRSEEDEQLYADRFAWSRLGTLFNHSGIVLVMVGAVVGSLFGFRDTGFVVAEGATRAVGHGTGLALQLDSFTEESYPDGRPKDYYSEVVLLEGGQEVLRKTVRVNDPLVYNGVRFHQSFFGNAVDLEIKDDAGKNLYNGSIPLAYRSDSFGERPTGSLQLYHQNLILQAVGRIAGRLDPMIEPGEVLVLVYNAFDQQPVDMSKLVQREPKEVAGLSITFKRERQFTGLQVVNDPGGWIVWVACAIMLLGIGAVFYFPSRQVRMRRVGEGQGTALQVTGTAGRYVPFEGEFSRLTVALGRALRPGVGEGEQTLKARER